MAKALAGIGACNVTQKICNYGRSGPIMKMNGFSSMSKQSLCGSLSKIPWPGRYVFCCSRHGLESDVAEIYRKISSCSPFLTFTSNCNYVMRKIGTDSCGRLPVYMWDFCSPLPSGTHTARPDARPQAVISLLTFLWRCSRPGTGIIKYLRKSLTKTASGQYCPQEKGCGKVEQKDSPCCSPFRGPYYNVDVLLKSVCKNPKGRNEIFVSSYYVKTDHDAAEHEFFCFIIDKKQENSNSVNVVIFKNNLTLG